MAYVPGFESDLFLSYAREDGAWVNELQKQLTERLLLRLGSSDIWQDEKKLRTGQNWPAELGRAIRASAAFIAVLSRNYQGSKWCETELDTFLQEAEKKDALETGGYGRVLKVIKFPWLLNAHMGFLRDYEEVPFFARNAETGEERVLKRTSKAFQDAVDRLGFHIEKLFEAMLRGRENVFVARAAGDAAAERESLIREIRAAGYALSPPPVGAIPKELDGTALLQFIRETRVTVHPLGSASGRDDVRDVRAQIDLAIKAEKKVVFYLTRGHESASGEQKTLIGEIRENKWGLPEGTWALLENRSAMVLRRDLIDLLAPPQRAAARGEGSAARVYLLCDPTTPEDAGYAREVQVSIREKEKMQVEMPAGDSTSPGAQHERLLRECDGLLLYYQKAPHKWCQRSVGDLLTAEDRAGGRELKSKALLVGDENTALPGLTVIRRRVPFEIQDLEPFLAPLRATANGQGGAHAGA
jgi:hypothetical protein